MEPMLDKVIKELHDRKVDCISEIIKVVSRTRELLLELNICNQDIYKQALKDIEYDASNALKLNQYISRYAGQLSGLTYPLKVNKNFELLVGTLEFYKNYTHYLFADNLIEDLKKEMLSYERVLFKDWDSCFNYIKVFYYSVLILALDKDMGKLRAFFQNNELFNVNMSSNVQTTVLPCNIESKLLEFNLVNWKYYHRDELSPPQGELLYFTNGYAFGGSSEDLRYKDKKFRSEDCMTAVLRWIGAENEFSSQELVEFSTLEIEKFYDAYNSHKKSKFHYILSKYLTPIPALRNASIGNVFAYREYDVQNDQRKSNYQYSLVGHIGLVTNIAANFLEFQNISYARQIPEKEGLLFSKENMNANPHKKYMFFEVIKK